MGKSLMIIWRMHKNSIWVWTDQYELKNCLPLGINISFKINIMSKGQDSKKNVKKEPAKTAKEKRAAKRAKKNKGAS